MSIDIPMYLICKHALKLIYVQYENMQRRKSTRSSERDLNVKRFSF